MAWYEHWFDRDEYELVYQERDDEEARRCVDLIERAVDLRAECSLLDVGCGRGRHAIELARRGCLVTGVDLSEASIQEAKERAREAELTHRTRFLVGDMREPVCSGCVEGAMNLFTAFGYFEEEADHLHALEAIAEAVEPGGFFVQDFLNAPHVESQLVPEDRRTEDGVEIVQRRWIEDGRINKRIDLQRNGEGESFRESVRLLTLEDFERFYARVGLELEATYGDYDGRSYGPETPRLIMVSRRVR